MDEFLEVEDELTNLKAAVRALLDLLQETDVAKDERIGFAMDAADQLVNR
jgi:hypothetical protein